MENYIKSGKIYWLLKMYPYIRFQEYNLRLSKKIMDLLVVKLTKVLK